MAEDYNGGNGGSPPGLTSLVGRFARTGWGAVQNRIELFALEWQEEKHRLAQLLFRAVGVVFLAIMATLLFTITIIFLFPPELRLYVAAGFTVLYLLAAIAALVALRAALSREPFAETIDQVRKDRVWLASED